MSMLLRRHHSEQEDEQEQGEKQEQVPTSKSKVEEIKAYLTSKAIQFDESAKKDKLLALIE